MPDPTTDKENTVTEHHHHLTLTVKYGELHPGFTCTAPPNADCRRRPAHYTESGTEGDHPCWAVEWIDADGIEDVLRVNADGVLASVPVTITYDEGVEATPIPEESPDA